MIDNTNYKNAEIKTVKNNILIEWYFSPSFSIPLKRYRKTFELNRIKDTKLQLAVAKEIQKAINAVLVAGLDPLSELTPNVSGGYNYVLIDELKRAYNNILATITKPRTIQTYNNHFKHLSDYIKAKKLDKLHTTEFNKMHAKQYQQHLSQQDLNNKTINTKISFASNLFNELVNIDIITTNPFEAVKRLKTTNKQLDIYTREELALIKAHLLKHMPELWTFATFVYYTFMRPQSIVNLRVKDIDFKNDLLNVVGEFHKNGLTQQKQILPQHKKYLLHFQKLDPNTLLFSKLLKPGTIKIAATRPAEFWARYVKKDLDINKNMYLLKDSGAVHYLEKNKGKENLKWLQIQMSHADLQTTSIYTNKVTVFTLEDTSSIYDI